VLARKAHPKPVPVGPATSGTCPHFGGTSLETLTAMVVGMLVTGAIFLSIVGLKTWDQVTVQYPTQALLAMAAGMTIPMMAPGYGTQERL
jgi:hypothetical protein